MIIIIHKNETVVEIRDIKNNKTLNIFESNTLKAMFDLAKTNAERIFVWCHLDLLNNLNHDYLCSFFISKNRMVSFSYENYFPDAIGYVEDSVFVNVNKTLKYPTWLMSSDCGAISGNALLKFKSFISFGASFSYNLNSIAKLGMKQGLFCYSDPKILTETSKVSNTKRANSLKLFKFVKQHYKARWVFLLFLNHLIFENKFPIAQLLNSLFVKRKKFNDEVESQQTDILNSMSKGSISVLIPTLGRASYLHNVLKDLESQNLKPKEVIIIEQNEDKNAQSELTFLKTEQWSFEIKHKLIDQLGACNARNVGLQLVNADYIFFADDDIRFGENVLNDALSFIKNKTFDAVVLSCLRKGDVEKHNVPIQFSSFGSGCSIVKSDVVKDVKFNMVYEHGFGEDSDFGMQLRNNGIDIIYIPYLRLLHLKAPIGGFRKEITKPWKNETLAPKPSPTIMIYRTLHSTLSQLRGYKLTLLLKFYKDQHIKNPFKYYSTFKKRWNISKFWANQLINTNKK